MKMKMKFVSKNAHLTCYNHLEGNAFCFRNHASSKIIEFFYEYSMRSVARICDNELGLEGKYEIIFE